MESDCRQPYAYGAAADADADDDGQGHFLQQQQQQQQSGGGERKRRFTEEQVRSLERTFHSRRARLEPREKAALARELGLRPRQVAIWFQNKRARWRSKQLEHDFADLRDRHDALRARVEALKQEKLALAAQLEELKEKLNGRQGQSGSSVDGAVAAEVDDKTLVETAPTAAAADVVLEGSAAGWYAYDDHLAAYGGGLPEPFCATPELWETTAWPLVEWNAVA